MNQNQYNVLMRSLRGLIVGICIGSLVNKGFNVFPIVIIILETVGIYITMKDSKRL